MLLLMAVSFSYAPKGGSAPSTGDTVIDDSGIHAAKRG